jgi:electron transfer flavoprotein beta subunit
MVPGMLAVGYTILAELTIDGTSAKHQEKWRWKGGFQLHLPLIVGGQKDWWKDLRIPNMRGIMTARTKVMWFLNQ